MYTQEGEPNLQDQSSAELVLGGSFKLSGISEDENGQFGLSIVDLAVGYIALCHRSTPHELLIPSLLCGLC